MGTGDLYLGICILPPIFLVLCGIVAWQIYWLNRAGKVEQLGRIATAKVVDYRARRYDRIISVEFNTSEGKFVTTQIRYLGGPQRIHKDAQVSIRYNPSDPSEAVIANEDPGIEGLYILYTGVLIFIILGYWFWLFFGKQKSI